MEAIESGEYQKIYDKWFGPQGEVPYPLSETGPKLPSDEGHPR